MLLAVGNPTVDYMSLDIEGAEEGVSISLAILPNFRQAWAILRQPANSAFSPSLPK